MLFPALLTVESEALQGLIEAEDRVQMISEVNGLILACLGAVHKRRSAERTASARTWHLEESDKAYRRWTAAGETKETLENQV